MSIYDVTTLSDLKFMNHSNTAVQASHEGIGLFIEQEINPELFARIISGEFGEIEACDLPVIDETTKYRESLVISRLQAKAILYQNGLLEPIETLINGADFLVQMAWREAQVIRRNSPLIEVFREELKWPDNSPITDEQLDQLFVEAAKIEF